MLGFSALINFPPPALLPGQRKNDVAAELSDDEELREQLDMHSIIVSCLAEEPLFTAEQVGFKLTSSLTWRPPAEQRQLDKNPSSGSHRD